MDLSDLITSYKELAPDDDALEKIASLLGFSLTFNEAVDVAPAPSRLNEQVYTFPHSQSDVAASSSDFEEPAEEKQDDNPEDDVFKPSSEYITKVSQRKGEGEIAVPAWFNEVKALPNYKSPKQEKIFSPLFDPNHERAIFQDTLYTEVAEGEILLDNFIEHIVKGRPIEEILYESVPTFRNGVQVILDTSESLAPFYRDQQALIGNMQTMLGKGMVKIHPFYGFPFGSKEEVKSYLHENLKLIPGVPVLFLSDLGLLNTDDLSKRDERKHWLYFCEFVGELGSRAIAYIPVPEQHWGKTLQKSCDLYYWDRPNKWVLNKSIFNISTKKIEALFTQHQEIIKLAQINISGFDLAVLLSIAVKVEPSILRKVRRYFLPHATIKAETDLWNSILIESKNASACVLKSDIQAALQEFLGQYPEILAQLETYLNHLRTEMEYPELFQLEERIDALTQRSDTDDLVDLELKRVAKTMLERYDTGLLAWSDRILKKNTINKNYFEGAYWLKLLQTVDFKEIYTENISPESASFWNEIFSQQELVEIGVRFGENGLEITDTPTDQHRKLKVIDMYPRWLIANFGNESKKLSLEKGQTLFVSTNERRMQLKTLLGFEYQLEREVKFVRKRDSANAQNYMTHSPSFRRGNQETRPAIIIGLGGTGRWILTYIKKELLEINSGKMPSNVRLLAFDMLPGSTLNEEEQVSIGNVKLDMGKELVNLSGNRLEFIQSVRRNSDRHTHISSWFDAQYYLERTTSSLRDLPPGTAQSRQFGRLSFFMKVENEIWPRLLRAYRELQAEVSKGHELEVMIISSFAGGTGAGMFIDMGVVARALANLVNNNLMIRGFIVLPRAFGGGWQLGNMANRMLARSFAAWRELDRFVTMGADFGTRRITYRPGDSNLDINQIEDRPFNVCYLIDSKRTNYSLETVDPRHGVYPSVADFIGAILDPEAGWDYTAHIMANVGGAFQAESQAIPRYSTFGTYAFKVPIYFGLQQHAFSFSHDLLDMLLVPRRDQNRNVIGLSKMANPEKEGLTGAQESTNFLRSTDVAIRYRDKDAPGGSDLDTVHKIENTALFPRIAEIYESNLINNQGAITQDAEGGHTITYMDEIEPGSFLAMMTQLPSDAADSNLNRDIESELKVSIWDAAPTSKARNGDPRYDADIIVHEVENYRRQHFGVAEIGVTGYRGSFGNLLDRALKFHVERFKLLISQWTNNTLNGYSDDPKVARRGKLGFVTDFYDGLVKRFDYFVEYLELVRSERDKMQLRQIYAQNMDHAKLSMLENARRRLPLGVGTHPQAHRSQEAYLAAVDDKCVADRDDMLLESLIKLTGDVRDIAVSARNEAEKWIKVLVTGDVVQSVEGLYTVLERELREYRAIFNFDKETHVTQRLIEVADYQKNENDIGQELSRVRWRTSTENGFAISCGVQVPHSVDTDDGEVWEDRELMLNNQINHVAQEHNRSVFLQLGKAKYSYLADDNKIVKMLMTSNEFRNARNLAHYVLSRSEPLGIIRSGASVKSHVPAMIARMHYKGMDETVDDYVRDFQENIAAQNLRISLPHSRDSHRFTIVRTTENIPGDHFQIWSELRDAYLKHIHSGVETENASRLHIFPAEVNAAKYEKMLSPVLNKGHRVLHPRVVTLLENEHNAILFFRCYALGYIKEVVDEYGMRSFEFTMPGEEIKLTSTNQTAPGFIAVTHAFTNIGQDANNPQKYLNYDDVLRYILREEQNYRQEGELVDIYQKQISDGLVALLRQQGKEMMDETRRQTRDSTISTTDLFWSPGQDLIDLADLAEMIFLQIIKDSKVEL